MTMQNAYSLRRMATVFSLIGLCLAESSASEVCKNNSGNTKRVCLDWSQGSAPVETTDFTVDYNCGGCSDDPAVDLKTGDTAWVLYSEVISTGAAANIGALTTTDSDNYAVKIANGTGPGAADVGSMVLSPSGDNYSSLKDSYVYSVAGGFLLKETSAGVGGIADGVSVGGGGIAGSVIVPKVQSLTISSVGGDLDIGEILSDGTLDLTSTDESNIDIGVMRSDATFRVEYNLGTDTQLTIGTLESGALIELASYAPAYPDVYGDITLTNGLPAGATLLVHRSVKSTSVVDLNGAALAGTLEVEGSFEGTLNAGSVATTGSVDITGPYDTAGGMNISGDVDGAIELGLSLEGDIDIGGNLDGSITTTLLDVTIDVGGNLTGTVTVENSTTCSGNVLAKSGISGDIDIPGRMFGDIVADSDFTGGGDLTGDVTIGVDFLGNICGANLDPEDALPENISIASFGPYWTICGELGCTCDATSCSSVDCNTNDELDICEILDGTYEDCDCDDIPDAGGSCDPTNQDAELYTSKPEDEDTWWRSQNNIARLTFYCDVSAPGSGDVTIQEMLDDGEFDDDLSDSFDFTIEDDENGDPRILKIEEDGSVLTHATWYSIRNTGDWSGVADFEVQYLLQMGDCDNNGLVLSLDVGCVNAAIPCFVDCGDDRREDMDGSGTIISLDVGVVNGHIPSWAVSKPSGH